MKCPKTACSFRKEIRNRGPCSINRATCNCRQARVRLVVLKWFPAAAERQPSVVSRAVAANRALSEVCHQEVADKAAEADRKCGASVDPRAAVAVAKEVSR